MPIDKIIPKRLNYDGDQRTLPSGDMVDAQDITISLEGEGSAGVVKNSKGTIAGDPLTPTDAVINSDGSVAIGQASDSQRGYVYFAVWSSNGNHSIYQYNSITHKYRLVLRDAKLNFKEDAFVKMDVVTGDFNQDGTIDSLLYLTDNVNPPRKINVDRALVGEYSGLSANKWDYSVNTIKAQPLFPPTATFGDDPGIQYNNLRGQALQFATQVVYRDGEESAISTYSKLTVSNASVFVGLEEYGYGFSPTSENVCLIKLNLQDPIDSTSFGEVKRVKILARNGNSGGFYIVDEFIPNEDLIRNVFGSDTTVYSPSSDTYRFYNDVLGTQVPENTVNKVYDNVPQLAEGQTVVGNRLMYSNYTEGYENTKVRCNLSVKYDDGVSGFDSYINSDVIDSAITSTSFPGYQFTINTPVLFGMAATDVLPSQTAVTITFSYGPIAGFVGVLDGSNLFEYEVAYDGSSSDAFPNQDESDLDAQPNQTATISGTLLPMTQASGGSYPDESTPKVTISFVTSDDLTITEVGELIAANLSNTVVPVEYEVTDFSDQVSLQVNTEPPLTHQGVVLGGSFVADFSFEDTVNTDGVVVVNPQISSLNLNPILYLDVVPTDTYSVSLTDIGPQVVASDDDNPITVLSPDATADGFLIYNKTATASQAFLDFGFKSGAIHKIGVVYADKWGRTGFVNEAGTAYAGWYNDTGRIIDGEVSTGPPSINIEITSDPPEWAEVYHIVYPGNGSVNDFVQYTVGNAFPARVGDLDLSTTRDVDINSRRLYVSLETLQQYKSDKSTARDYSFTKGDKLRVVSYRGDTEGLTISPELLGTKYPGATDGSIIEFDVVGVETLTAAVENPISFKKDSTGTEVAITSTNDILDEHIGTFIVLENPAISSGASDDNGEALKYKGFDWNSIVRDIGFEEIDTSTGVEAYRYIDGSAPTASVNHWESQVVVEIYTPKLSSGSEVFYEIGHTRRVGRYDDTQNEHGPAFTISCGDVNYRPVPCKGPWYTGSASPYAFNPNDPDEWRYETKPLENNFVIETSSDTSWNAGRPHVKYEAAATVRRYNGITYSDAYNEDVANLTLSSFNASLVNFYSLQSKYGAVRYIHDFGDIGSIAAVQENKFSLTTVDKSIITDASGSGNVALSTNVLGTTKYYSGDYGCAQHPESVLVQDNEIYFFDRSRQKVLRFSGGQLTPISDKGVASKIESEIKKFNAVYGLDEGKIISGYDPNDDLYYITLRPTQSFTNFSSDDTPGDNEEVVEVSDNSYAVSFWFKYEGGGGTHSRIQTLLSDYDSDSDTLDSTANDASFSMFCYLDLGATESSQITLNMQQRLWPSDTVGAQSNAITFDSTGAVEVTPNEWQHVVYSFDTVAQEIRVYLQGELAHTISSDSTGSFPYSEEILNGNAGFLDFDGSPLRIARRVSYSNVQSFAGLADDFAFYNQALSNSEVQSVFNTGIGSTPPEYDGSLVTYYPMNGSAATTVGDPLNTGIVFNASLTEDRFSNQDSAYQFSGNPNNYIDLPSLRSMIPQVLPTETVVTVGGQTGTTTGSGDGVSSTYAGITLMYDPTNTFSGMRGTWIARMSFTPHIYANQNNVMLSCMYVGNLVEDSNPLMFHRHEDSTASPNRATYYGQSPSTSFVKVMSNVSPSDVKVYNSISYEGDSSGFEAVVESENGSRTAPTSSFDKREEGYFVGLGGDVTPNSSSQYMGIGLCVGVDTFIPGSMILSPLPFGVSIPGGALIKKLDPASGALLNVGPSPDVEVTVNDIQSDGTILTSAVDVSDAINSVIVLITDAEIDGDDIRGHYATIKLSTQSATPYEVYCVNAHVAGSKLHHS